MHDPTLSATTAARLEAIEAKLAGLDQAAAAPVLEPSRDMAALEAIATELAALRADIEAASAKIAAHEHAFEAIKGISL